MKTNKEQTPSQSDPIQALSRKLIPVCWFVILLLVVGLIVAAIQVSTPNSTVSALKHVFLPMIGFPFLFWTGVVLLIIRFLYNCDRHGIFSKKAVSSIRWIGLIILAKAAIKLTGLVVSGVFITTATTTLQGTATYLLSPFAASITNVILGLFLVILAKIMTVGSGLEKEAKLTI